MTLTLDVTHAADRFRTLSGLGDNGVRYAAGRNQPGKCTRWTWFALSEDGQGFANTSPLPHAVGAWENAPAEHRHPLTEKPFAGAVLIFGATTGPRWAGTRTGGTATPRSSTAPGTTPATGRTGACPQRTPPASA
ncbi:hypothetical protein P9139_18170 [Curtobacterium flaccumfaciens]|nr:hypothetical protein P9139_18170 [Curtobacterium flaccumfaciens]